MASILERHRFDRLTSEAKKEIISPSARLVARLATKLVTPTEELSKLVDKKVILISSLPAKIERQKIGTITSVSGRNAVFNPEQEHIYYQEGLDYVRNLSNNKPRSIKVYFATDNPYGENYEPGENQVDYSVPSVKYAVFQNSPTTIYVPMGVSGDPNYWNELIKFNIKDVLLDPLLTEGLRASRSIKSSNDLADLTIWLDHKFPKMKFANKRYLTFGEELRNHGFVCRDIATMAFGILELSGLSCSLIGAQSPITKEKHLYLGIDSGLDEQKERIIYDPTWGIWGTQKDILRLLKSANITPDLHIPEVSRDLRLFPSWEPITPPAKE